MDGRGDPRIEARRGREVVVVTARTIGAIAAAVVVAAMAIAILVLREEVRTARADAAAAQARAQEADERTRAAMDAAARAVRAADDLLRRQKEAYDDAIKAEAALAGVDDDWLFCPLPAGVRDAVRAVHGDGGGDTAGGARAVRDTDGGSDEY